MAGIAGVVLAGGAVAGEAEAAATRRMAGALAHRGGGLVTVLDGPLCLSFVGAEAQTASSAEGALRLWLDGTLTDGGTAASALALYERHGPSFLEHLCGHFALALWDRGRRTLLLARDRFGARPLFHHEGKTLVAFGSEVKAVLRAPSCPKEFDWAAALSDPFTLSQAPVPREPPSYFRGIRPVPAAHLLEVLPNRAPAARRYWSLPEPLSDKDAPPDEELVQRYGEELGAAVARMMGDGAVGMMLSAGVDSLAVAAHAAKAGNVTAFTVMRKAALGDDPVRVQAAADACGIECHHVTADWAELLSSPERWRELVWACELPFTNPEQFYKFHIERYARRTFPSLRRMFTGQGSDEFNGGHSGADADWSEFEARTTRAQKSALLSLAPGSWARLDEYLDLGLVRREFLLDELGLGGLRPGWRGARDGSLDLVQSYKLWHEDRVASCNGFEVCSPFFDHRLVELTARIPESRHARLFFNKRILRDALAFLPESVRSKPKASAEEDDDHLHVARMLLAPDGLYAKALPEGARGREILSEEGLSKLVEVIERDPRSDALNLLLRICNMGVLEQLGREAAAVRQDDIAGPTAAFSGSQEEISQRVSSSAPAPQPELELELDAVVGFAENVMLLRPDGANAEGGAYLLIDGQAQFGIEEGGWLRVLRAIDGARTLREVLERAEVSADEVRDELQQCLAERVLKI